MQKYTIIILFTIVTLAPPVIAEPVPLKMSDFDYGSELTSSESEFTRFVIKPNMIKNIKQHDLGDVRIFDGNNELMPSLIRKKDGANKLKRQMLSFSHLRTKDNATAYILDRTENHKRSLKSLSLQWKKGTQLNMMLVRVEHSADKKLWKTLKEAEAISNFMYEGTIVKQNIIDINDFTKRYIRVTFLSRRQSPVLASAHIYTTNTKISDYSWIPADKLKIQKGMSNAYRFNLNKGIRPELLKLSFPKLNSILNGALNSVETINEKLQYKPVFKYFNAYVVTINNKVIKSRPINLSRWKSSDWLITAKTLKNIQPEDLPRVILAYPQYEIIFTNSGEAPYTVVWGNPTAGKPMTGDVLERMQAKQDIAEVKSGIILNNARLTELMESRQIPWLIISISIAIAIIAVSVLVFAYRRNRLYKK